MSGGTSAKASDGVKLFRGELQDENDSGFRDWLEGKFIPWFEPVLGTPNHMPQPPQPQIVLLATWVP